LLATPVLDTPLLEYGLKISLCLLFIVKGKEVPLSVLLHVCQVGTHALIGYFERLKTSKSVRLVLLKVILLRGKRT